MKCFLCAKDIVVPPDGDPIYDTQPLGTEHDYYFPATVLEVVETGECRCTVICWECFNRMDPDMWSDKAEWESFNPAVPYEKLPSFDHDAEDNYKIDTYAGYSPVAKPAEAAPSTEAER